VPSLATVFDIEASEEFILEVLVTLLAAFVACPYQDILQAGLYGDVPVEGKYSLIAMG